MYIKIIAHVNSKKEEIKEIKEAHFEIWLKEKAEKNMANKKIIQILADFFKISAKNIRIVNGHHHPHKLLVVDKKML